MKKSVQVAGSLVGAGMMVVAGASAAIAVPVDQADAANVEAVSQEALCTDATVESVAVEGSFAYTQDTVTDSASIAGAFRTATNAVCSSLPNYGAIFAAIAVSNGSGDSFEANVEELSEECGESHIMGCSCASNVAGGGAIINAEVTGVPVASLASMAGL